MVACLPGLARPDVTVGRRRRLRPSLPQRRSLTSRVGYDYTASPDGYCGRTYTGWSAAVTGCALLRSRFEFGDGRRVGKLRRDLCGVNAGRAENRRPEVQCLFGSSVSASCAGSTYRRFHSLPVRTRIHLYWRCHRVRLPVVPRSFPLRGLMASRYRGECVSTPHQGRSELHRHPKRVLRLSRVSSFSPEDQSSELQARFLVNGSHLGAVVGRLDAVLCQKHPERVHLAQQAAGKPARLI
jgi:hypothetical protein